MIALMIVFRGEVRVSLPTGVYFVKTGGKVVVR